MVEEVKIIPAVAGEAIPKTEMIHRIESDWFFCAKVRYLESTPVGKFKNMEKAKQGLND